MMLPQSIFITCIVLISISSMYEAKSSKSSSTISFTTDLIHRDSPQSPYYDPLLSPSQRLASSIQRSYKRLHHFNKCRNKCSPTPKLIRDTYEYLMTYQIGTPPVRLFGVADTGSDLLWTQCAPCQKCFKQKLPLFYPKKSQTYKIVPCNSTLCNTTPGGSCDESRKKCPYSYYYGGGSYTIGDLATDTLTLPSSTGKPVSLPNIAFGCGFNNTVYGFDSGIVGLGGGNASLVLQLGPSIIGKFAHCLVSRRSSSTTKSSKLHFGDNAIVSGGGVVSTPLVPKDPPTFYYVTLEGISVGNQTFETSSKDSSGYAKEGNIIIDSGTTLTSIPRDLYGKLEKALLKVVKLKRDQKSKDGLCWFTKTDDGLPTMTVHFKGADVVLNTENTFYRMSKEVMCLAMAPSSGFFIYGNFAQTNFLIGYDLQKKTVSFKRRDCTKY